MKRTLPRGNYFWLVLHYASSVSDEELSEYLKTNHLNVGIDCISSVQGELHSRALVAIPASDIAKIVSHVLAAPLADKRVQVDPGCKETKGAKTCKG